MASSERLKNATSFKERMELLFELVYMGNKADFCRDAEISESLLSKWLNTSTTPREKTIELIELKSGWVKDWLYFGSSKEYSRPNSRARKRIEAAYKLYDSYKAEFHILNSLASKPWGYSLNAIPNEVFEQLGGERKYLSESKDVLPPQANEAAPAATDALSETARALKAQGDNLMPPLEQIEEPVFPRQHTLTIPYYDIPVNAGQAVPLDIAPPTLLVFDYVSYKNPNKLFGVLVSGDSMIGVGIVNRSRLICERTEDVERAMDRVVIACTQDGTVVKLLTRNQEGRPVLRSDNPAKDYPDIMVDETVRIQAIVVKALNDI